MPKPIEPLRQIGGEITALRAAEGLLAWDQETNMPGKGGAARAESLAAVSTVLHQRQTSDAFWGSIAEAESLPDLSDREKAMARGFRRDAEKARRIPAELAAELWR